MKDLRDLKDLTIHDVKPISDESPTGRRHSLRADSHELASSSKTALRSSKGNYMYCMLLQVCLSGYTFQPPLAGRSRDTYRSHCFLAMMMTFA